MSACSVWVQSKTHEWYSGLDDRALWIFDTPCVASRDLGRVRVL